MTQKLKIDFVSDVSCPWCVVGLRSLDQALANVAGEITADIHFQPFELNPGMAPEGQDMTEHITEKYGSTPAQQAQSREMIRERGAELGFTFDMDGRRRIYNTFDAHRLLHWAESVGKQRALKEKLFEAYFTNGENVSAHDVLLRLAGEVGLDQAAAREVLESTLYADEVRQLEYYWQRAGIRSVPAIVINQRHLISGGQPPEVFEQALRQIAQQDEQLEQDEEPAT
jgi:predicted DsbA family dithiol-disulfide isomerase